MGRVLFGLFALFAQLRPEPQAPRGWEPLAAPAPLSAIAPDPSDSVGLLAGSTDGRLFRTTDGGSSWSPLLVPQALASVTAIAAVPGAEARIFLGGAPAPGGTGLLVSKDGGSTWSGTALPAGVVVFDVTPGPDQASTVYLAGRACEVNSCQPAFFTSRDEGQTWSLRAVATSLDSVGPIAVDPRSALTVFLASSHGLRRSDDGGLNWSVLPGGGLNVCGAIVAVAMHPAGILFASAATPTLLHHVCNGIYRLRPGEPSMTGPHGTGEIVRSLAFDPRDSAVAYASGSRFNIYGPAAMFRTVDGGESWHPFDRGLTEPIHRVAIRRDGAVMYALSARGALFSLNLDANPHGGLRRSPRRVAERR